MWGKQGKWITDLNISTHPSCNGVYGENKEIGLQMSISPLILLIMGYMGKTRKMDYKCQHLHPPFL